MSSVQLIRLTLYNLKSQMVIHLPTAWNVLGRILKRQRIEGIEKALGHNLDYSTYDVLARESTVSNELREASF